MKNIKTKLLIIGSGPAGYTAAIYSARANLNPVLVAGLQPGGQMTITTDVENYPGFGDVIQGPWLMDQMKIQAEKVGMSFQNDIINKIDLSKKPFKAIGDSGTEYLADSIIISTGAQARFLNIKSEKKFIGYGISACATCDGFFFKDKDVAVIGGGNTAAEEALFLTKFASKVTIVHRRDSLRSEKILQDRLFKNSKINFIWNKTVNEFVGKENDKSLDKIILKDVNSNDLSELKVDGVFVAIGHDPSTNLFKGQIDMDEDNYIITKSDSTLTSIEGVYAAGDVQDKTYRQAITAAGMGCMAAIEAEKYLAKNT
ncbi:MAG: thioredoxin-disulfide reductase [Pelagibacteraceae bacterium]|nr:thioredoxin-disulfide reductase [Pelagibacteraceae bacterium]PPR51670.1 MAG: Thioredoxin reductase [Alphaproteobacteria bacterium MarineAlpha5_Bin10]|tara:strand:- start:7675 stop:8616 length:942 start_codon:yes stop_codon:yes gene_type:complete